MCARLGGVVAGIVLAGTGVAAEVALVSPRTVYNAAEGVRFAVRAGAGGARLELRHSDGSAVLVDVPPGQASRVVMVSPFVLKPGDYVASLAGGAPDAGAKFTVAPAEHASAYWVGEWVHHGREPDVVRAKGGWMFVTGDYGVWLNGDGTLNRAMADAYAAGSMRPYHLMILGGGHQLDLDLVNDWGDPWVQRAVAWRLGLGALRSRDLPFAGLHCYDEPGLTWWPVPDEGMSPYAIPHQLEEFTKLTGKKIPGGGFNKAAPKYARMMDDWVKFIDMRMKYLEQAWVASIWGTDSVCPRLETVNQVSSSYSAGNATDGVDGRQARPYRVVSGHGGYSDLPFGSFQPLRSAEGMQAFTRGRPHLYLPTWYTHNWGSIRNGIWASWITKLEGMLYTPEQCFPLDNSKFDFSGANTVFEIAEINRRLALVGGVMTQLRKAPSPVAVLWSHREAARDVARNNSPAVRDDLGVPMYSSQHSDAVNSCFWRVLGTGIVPNWIDEEEAIEGGAEFLRDWKVILCPKLTDAEPAFRKALEGYARGGGKLVQFRGDKLRVPGSVLAYHEVGSGHQRYKKEIEPLQQAKDPALAKVNMDLAWRKWDASFAPTFAKDLDGWLGELPYRAANTDVLLTTHGEGRATYVLMANNAQSEANPRGVKQEFVPATSEVRLPAGGVVYDLLNGGEVHVKGGRAVVELAAGDGACWLHLPAAPGRMDLSARFVNDGGVPGLEVALAWGTEGFLPFRLRILDPAGNELADLYRATAPRGGRTVFEKRFPLGANAAPGSWTVEASEWMTGKASKATARVLSRARGEFATVEGGKVSVFFEDARRIADLFAGRAAEPPYEKLNWDSKRVFNLDRRKFAVFGPDAHAGRIASALRVKGMKVEVNPAYAVEKFVREEGRGGAGPVFREQNYENIHAHAVVLEGHDLAKQAARRGCVNFPVTADFPGPGRAYVQWGMGAFQAGWQDVFVLGDLDAGVAWVLDAIGGRAAAPTVAAVGSGTSVPAKAPARAKRFEVRGEIRTADTPVGVASSPDGATTYVLVHGGRASAVDKAGRTLWQREVLMEGWDLAVSPKGDRLAVAGYPGLLVLDARTGRELGGSRAAPGGMAGWGSLNFVGSAAWNDAGTVVAGGWANDEKSDAKLVLVDANGRELAVPKDVPGVVRGVAFVPGTDRLLVGADELLCVDAKTGRRLWSNGVRRARAFAFSADGRTAAAGGWGRTAGVFDLASGALQANVDLKTIVGGVALTPKGDLVAAAWGGTRPLQVIRKGEAEAKPFFRSSFGFQDVLWSRALGGLVAAEQGGRLWLLGADGAPLAELGDDAGTTPYRMSERAGEILLGRMNRAVQRLAVR